MNYIEVNNVSKVYTQYASEWERVGNWFGGKFKPKQAFKALDDVSFSVRTGETISIIGRNGAGKSTLLKILAGTAFPSSGEVRFAGSVSGMLEMSLGFNPEYTGLDNVKTSLSMRGFSPTEVKAALPYIEDFADIGSFFTQHVRTYSTGMAARLGFAVVTAKRPEVLIVDEGLVVGDQFFVGKCFDKIREFQSLGTTIIITGHTTIHTDRMLLLDKGRLLAEGEPQDILSMYAHMYPTP